MVAVDWALDALILVVVELVRGLEVVLVKSELADGVVHGLEEFERGGAVTLSWTMVRTSLGRS